MQRPTLGKVEGTSCDNEYVVVISLDAHWPMHKMPPHIVDIKGTVSQKSVLLWCKAIQFNSLFYYKMWHNMLWLHA